MTREQTKYAINCLKGERAKRGITQELLAKCINVSHMTVWRWENDGFSRDYIRLGLRYFFETWEKNPLRKCGLDEIPDHPTLATGKWLTWWMDTEGVSVAELADKLCVTGHTVRRWRKAETEIPIIAEYAIRQAMKDLGK